MPPDSSDAGVSEEEFDSEVNAISDGTEEADDEMPPEVDDEEDGEYF